MRTRIAWIMIVGLLGGAFALGASHWAEGARAQAEEARVARIDVGVIDLLRAWEVYELTGGESDRQLIGRLEAALRDEARAHDAMSPAGAPLTPAVEAFIRSRAARFLELKSEDSSLRV